MFVFPLGDGAYLEETKLRHTDNAEKLFFLTPAAAPPRGYFYPGSGAAAGGLLPRQRRRRGGSFTPAAGSYLKIKCLFFLFFSKRKIFGLSASADEFSNRSPLRFTQMPWTSLTAPLYDFAGEKTKTGCCYLCVKKDFCRGQNARAKSASEI